MASLWAGVSIINSPGHGINLGSGAAIDTSNGFYGSYDTVGAGPGLAQSAGLEAGVYTGSISGETTTYTLGIGPFSLGFVKGDKWWEIGIVGGLSAGLSPFELSKQTNCTEFDDLDWAETMWETYDGDTGDEW